MKDKNPTKKALEVTENFNNNEILSDVNGSYTGFPLNNERPIQDADDLRLFFSFLLFRFTVCCKKTSCHNKTGKRCKEALNNYKLQTIQG